MKLLSNLLGPRQAFDGGLFLRDYKAITARRPIEWLHADGPLHIPLSVRADFPVTPVVDVGDRVIRGQRLTIPDTQAGLPVHSPISGHIARFESVWSPFDGAVPGIVIDPDGRRDAVPPVQSWADESVIGQLVEHGVVCPMSRQPLHTIIREAVRRGVSELIVNAMETEPYLTADLRTLVEDAGRVVDTTSELADALSAVRAIIAAPFRHRHVMKRLLSDAAGRMVEVAVLPDPFPQCHPHLLIKSILNREVEPGGSPLDLGVVVLPLSTVRQAAEALLDDRAVTHVLLTVAGDAVDRPGTYRVPIGMPIRRIAESIGLTGPVRQAVIGGPLTGIPMRDENAVVTIDMTAVLLFTTTEQVNPVDCIRCGWCIEDCPIGLSPPDLVRLESRATVNSIEMSHLRACIDCGLCTHVCPSQLPLSQTIKSLRDRFDGGEADRETGRR